MLNKTFLGLLFIFIFISCSNPQPKQINLSGAWNYQLDAKNLGIKEQWFTKKLANKLTLPAALRDQGIGYTPTLETQWTGSIYDSTWYFNPAMKKYRKKDSLKFPFWLTPVKRFVGAAWYQKEIIIPKNWKNKPLELFLERPHWQTEVWIDSTKIGEDKSLSTPHLFSSKPLTVGKHLLTIRVDNAINDVDPGINSHSISDHTQGNWNGIIGKMELRAKNKNNIKGIKITPDVQNKQVKVKITLNQKPSEKLQLSLKIDGVNHSHSVNGLSQDIPTKEVTLKIPMGDSVKTWSEFAPNIYKMVVSLTKEKQVLDRKTTTFGMREFTINKKQFAINGVPISLRGTTDCSVFPLTGHPPTNEEEWTRIYETAKSFGLNHFRFHSYCPPEAAFYAADKAGIYLQIEGPSWAKYSVTLGDGLPIDEYLMKESKRIIDTYGNHPSFVMMGYGNEPSGNYVPYLENWVDTFRAYDPQRVFTGASTGRSWSIIENSDFIVRSPPRGLEWKDKQPESVFDYRDKTENQNKPYVTFEMGQWCVFPNFKEIDKYTGVLKARNFELFKEDLADHYMAEQANDFLMASGKLQLSCYKQEIEATLRTPNLAGFQLLGLNDFSGQGSALVGVLDAFWDEKGYASAEEFKAFCSEVVPLVRLPKYTFSASENLIANFEVANFNGVILKDQKPAWQLLDEKGQQLKSGTLTELPIALGKGNELGAISVPLNFVQKAAKLTLKLNVGKYTNQWNIWVYPENSKKPNTKDLHISKILDAQSIAILENGGKVLLLADNNIENGKNVVQYAVPAFWNTSWFKMRPPHTTGIFIQEKHAVFNDFPTDFYSDLQWWELSNRQQVMNLEHFPKSFKPMVQPIDTWFLNRKLAMLFEANVLSGKIIVCSIDLNQIEKKGIVSKQLYKSLISYIQSDNFKPKNTLKPETIQELFEVKERKIWNSFAQENP